jgi:hypothetical protein
VALLRAAWEWWKPVAHRIADVQAALILGFLYFVLLAPFAVGMKLGAHRRPSRSASRWVPRPTPGDGDPVARARRQY